VAKQPNPQTEKFKAAARAVGCDESEEHFDVALGKVPRHKLTGASPRHKQMFISLYQQFGKYFWGRIGTLRRISANAY
jgi:hypothetical protein